MPAKPADLKDALRALIKVGLDFPMAKSVFAEANSDFHKELIEAARRDDRLSDDLQIEGETIASVGHEDDRSGWVLAWMHVNLNDEAADEDQR